MNARITVPFAALAASMLVVSTHAFAVSFSITDPCGKSLAGSSGASTNVNSSGDFTIADFTAPYSVGLGLCSPLPSGSVPICTLSASQTRVELNATVRLHAFCRTPAGQPITQYVWTSPPGAPALPGNSAGLNAIDLTYTTPGAFTYSVAPYNGNGWGLYAPQVTILVGNSADPAAVPVCTATFTPVSVPQGGVSHAHVICHPPAASMTWDPPESGAPPAPASGAPAGSWGALTFANGGAFTYKVVGRNAAGTAGPKTSATVTAAGPPAPSCSHSAVNYNISTSVGTFTTDVAMYPNWIAAFAFALPPGVTTTFSASSASYRLPDGVDVSISRCLGDYTVPAACRFQTYGGWNVMPRTDGGAGCQILPNTTYYVNVKQMDCWNPVTPGLCGFRLWRSPN